MRNLCELETYRNLPHYVIFPVSIKWPTGCCAPFIMFIKGVFSGNRGERSKKTTFILKNIFSAAPSTFDTHNNIQVMNVSVFI